MALLFWSIELEAGHNDRFDRTEKHLSEAAESVLENPQITDKCLEYLV